MFKVKNIEGVILQLAEEILYVCGTFTFHTFAFIRTVFTTFEAWTGLLLALIIFAPASFFNFF
jgi:hypothetical protein